jgi:Helix-turn-helix domain
MILGRTRSDFSIGSLGVGSGLLSGRFEHFDTPPGGSYRQVLAYAEASDAREVRRRLRRGRRHGRSPVDARSRVPLRHTARLRWLTPGSRSDRNIPSRRCCVRFSYRMVPEVYQVFWAGMAAGEFINDAAIAAGSYRKQGTRWLAAAGGVRPRRGRNLKGRCLTLTQREEIALGRARGESIRTIAALLGRSPSTVSRELRRNADGMGRYRATSAHALAYHRASRPKRGKLVQNLELRGKVEADLAKKYSPEQIAGRLTVEFPDQPEMQVSTETI